MRNVLTLIPNLGEYLGADMSTQLFLEHNDFVKSRRALFVTAVCVIIVSKMDFLSKSVKFFGLELGVDQKQILVFGTAAILYFMFIFAFHARTRFFKLRHDTKETMFAMKSNKIKEELAQYFYGLIERVSQEKDVVYRNPAHKGMVEEADLLVRNVLSNKNSDTNENPISEQDPVPQLVLAVESHFRRAYWDQYVQFAMTDLAPPFLAAIVALYLTWFA